MGHVFQRVGIAGRLYRYEVAMVKSKDPGGGLVGDESYILPWGDERDTHGRVTSMDSL